MRCRASPRLFAGGNLVARAVESVRPPWSVNAGALRAGLAALQPEAQRHVERARALSAESRVYLVPN